MKDVLFILTLISDWQVSFQIEICFDLHDNRFIDSLFQHSYLLNIYFGQILNPKDPEEYDL